MKLSSTIDELHKINKIVTRIETESRGIKFDPFIVIVTLDVANSNGIKLDFDKLLEFDSSNFWHDVIGIFDNIDVRTGNFNNCFLPRCAIETNENRRFL